MQKVTKFLAVSTAIVLGAFAVTGTASADEWRHHRHDGGDAVAAGIAGLAAGVIAGAIIASPPSHHREYVEDDDYYDPPPPPPRVYYRTTYVERPSYGGLRPWTRDWYNYCQDRYQSFDPRSGTFIGYDGRAHFCTTN